jgi:hypothetical protein
VIEEDNGRFVVLLPTASRSDSEENRVAIAIWAAHQTGELRQGTGYDSLGNGGTVADILSDGYGFFEEIIEADGWGMTSGWWRLGRATLVWGPSGRIEQFHWVGAPNTPPRFAGTPKPHSDVGVWLASKKLPPVTRLSFEQVWEKTAGEGKTLAEAFALEGWIPLLPKCEDAIVEGMAMAMDINREEAARALGVRGRSPFSEGDD